MRMLRRPMSDTKLTRKELKAPDEFQRIGAQAVPLLVQHQKTIVGAIVIFFVVGLGVGTIKYLGQRGEEQASEQLGAALKDISREVSATPPATPETGADKPFKSETEK